MTFVYPQPIEIVSKSTLEDLRGEVARLRAENARLKAADPVAVMLELILERVPYVQIDALTRFDGYKFHIQDGDDNHAIGVSVQDAACRFLDRLKNEL